MASTTKSSPGLPLAWVVVALAGIAAYARTLPVPFLFDDIPSIVENPTIRHIGSSFVPAADSTVSGRPFLNFSFAIDHALSGTAPGVYHATNLVIHVAAALLLLGIVRRVAELAGLKSAPQVGLAVALLWVLHPLDTESVTYVVQRAESLMGLLYLGTIYCFLRGFSDQAWWFGCSVLVCFVGMATKETMASAPIVVLLLDWTFLAGGFREALRSRWKVYLGLASSWILLGFLVLSTHGRTGTVGFGGAVTPLAYAKTQAWAVSHYLFLSFWPHPLVFDYGRSLVTKTPELVVGALVAVSLVAATAWGLVWRPVVGFLGASFILILAPSSSFIPVLTETVAEHRMYLALVPVIVSVVLLLQRALPRFFLQVCGVASAVLLAVTCARNEVYRSPDKLWRSVVAARPVNERAHNNLGYVLSAEPANLDEAISEYRRALELSPQYAQARLNLAMALVQRPSGLNEAVDQFHQALQLNPSLVDAHYNLGLALMAFPGHLSEAIAEFQAAIQLKPDYAEAHYNLGCAYGFIPAENNEAIAEYREALRLKPALMEAHFNLGCSLVREPNRTNDAISEFEAALALDPRYVPALCNLATALGTVGRKPEALERARTALAIEPGNAAAQRTLSWLSADVK